MPVARMPIPNSEYTVARSAVMSVIQDLKRYTYMGDDIQILFPNDSELVPTKGSSIHDRDRKVEYLTTKVLHLEVQEDTDPEFMLNVHTSQINNAPIFYDKDIDFSISPVYYRHQVQLTIKFRSDSRSEVANWRNGLKTRLAAGAQFGLTHTLQFHYHIPDKYYDLIKEIYDTKERNYPTGESFVEYYQRCSSKCITAIHDPNGAFRSLVVQESQSRVLGIYDISEMPEKPEKDADTSTYTATLVYKFNYMKPEFMFTKYPISVYNELLPDEYIIKNNSDESYRTRNQTANLNTFNFKKFEMHEQIKTRDEIVGFARYPYFDDTPLLPTFLGYKSYASFLISLDSDATLLLNLNELGDFHINPAILKFIKEVEYKYMTDPYKSVFSISLQKKDKIIAYHNLSLDEDLNLRSRLPLDIRHQYRVVFDICTEWYMLDRSAIDRLLKYPDVFAQVLYAINTALKGMVDAVKDYYKNNDYQAKKVYTEDDFDIALAILLDRARDSDSLGIYNNNNAYHKDYPFTQQQGNDILSRVPSDLLKKLYITSRKMKTVFATAIIAKRYDQVTDEMS